MWMATKLLPIASCLAGIRYRSHGADPYDQGGFRRAALLAFKGGEEADVNPKVMQRT